MSHKVEDLEVELNDDLYLVTAEFETGDVAVDHVATIGHRGVSGHDIMREQITETLSFTATAVDEDGVPITTASGDLEAELEAIVIARENQWLRENA